MKMKTILALVLMISVTALASASDLKKGDKKEATIGLNIGDKAPEIIEKSIDGKELRLSSLKGKLVLIDFWASWCGPCRRENPTVIASYDKFKSSKFKNAKGFTIFSVSLDKDRNAWEAAIKTDKLIWENHVSDLQGWESKYAGIYGIRSIPSNFLIDGDGIIIGKNLRGPALEHAISEILK